MYFQKGTESDSNYFVRFEKDISKAYSYTIGCHQSFLYLKLRSHRNDLLIIPKTNIKNLLIMLNQHHNDLIISVEYLFDTSYPVNKGFIVKPNDVTCGRYFMSSNILIELIKFFQSFTKHDPNAPLWARPTCDNQTTILSKLTL